MEPTDLLFENSPFLPKIEMKNLSSVITRAQYYHPVAALSQETNWLAKPMVNIIREEIQWIKEAFNVSVTDLDLFFFGYTLPSNLIIGADMARLKIEQDLIHSTICPPPSDEEQENRGKFVIRIHEKTSAMFDTTTRDPSPTATRIYSYCDTEVYAFNDLYLAGIESSRQTYFKLARLFAEPDGRKVREIL